MPFEIAPSDSPEASFGVVPRPAAPPNPEPGRFLEWRSAGDPLGDDRVSVVDFVGSNILATRGVGRNSHVITLRRMPTFYVDEPTDYLWPSTKLVAPLDADAIDYSPSPVELTFHGDARLTPTRSLYGSHAYEGGVAPSSSLRTSGALDHSISNNLLFEVAVFFTSKDVDQTLLHIPGVLSLRYSAAADTLVLSDPPSQAADAFSNLVHSPAIGVWTKVAFCYRGWNGTNHRKLTWVNGVSRALGAGAPQIGDFSGKELWIGGDGSSPFLGGMSQIRVTETPIGTLRWPEGQNYFPPPMAIPKVLKPAITNRGVSGPKPSAVRGAATASAAEYLSAPQSIYVPALATGETTLNGLVVASHADFDFGTEDFRIRLAGFRLGGTLQGTLFSCVADGGEMRLAFGNSANTRRFLLTWRSSGGVVATTYLPDAMPELTWTTLEMRRLGGVFQFLRDDSVIDVRSVPGGESATVKISSDLYFGCEAAASPRVLNGYIDNVQIWRGDVLVAAIPARIPTPPVPPAPPTPAPAPTFGISPA